LSNIWCPTLSTVGPGRHRGPELSLRLEDRRQVGKAIGVSEAALRDWCRVARCRPKRSFDFARLLRALVQSQRHGWDPFNLLDVANERTMKNLLRRGGLPDMPSTTRALTHGGFLVSQRFVTESLAASVERHRETIRWRHGCVGRRK